MKKLRIRKIITALIVITWVPSSFASPSSVASSSSYIYYYASPSSVASPSSIATPLSIVGIDGKNQINLNFITGSNGQLVIFEYCQDGSCKPLGLEEGYSLEMLEKFLEPWEKLSSDELLTDEEIDLGLSRGDEQQEQQRIQAGFGFALGAGILAIAMSSLVIAPIISVVWVVQMFTLFVAVFGVSFSAFEVVTGDLSLGLHRLSKKTKIRLSRSERILEIIDSGGTLELVVEGNTIRKIVTEIEKASEEGSKTLAPLFRD